MDVFWILSLCVCVNAYITIHTHYNGVKKQVSAKQTAAIRTGSSKQTLPLRIAKCNAVSFKCCMGGPGVRSQLLFVYSVRRGDQRLQRFRWKLQILSEEEASSFSWSFCVKILLFKFKKGPCLKSAMMACVLKTQTRAWKFTSAENQTLCPPETAGLKGLKCLCREREWSQCTWRGKMAL